MKKGIITFATILTIGLPLSGIIAAYFASIADTTAQIVEVKEELKEDITDNKTTLAVNQKVIESMDKRLENIESNINILIKLQIDK